MKSHIYVTLLATTVLTSCAAARARDHMNELQTAVEAYNHAFRWKNYDRAASFLPPNLRGAFLATHEDDAESLHVEDYKVMQVQLPSEDAAQVTVRIRYTLLPSVTVENRKVVQSWHKVAGNWILENESNPIREIRSDIPPKTDDSFGGSEEGNAEVEVTGPDGKVIRDDSGKKAVGSTDEAPEEGTEEAAEDAPPADEPKK